jgi:hypothetical protein
MDAVILLSGLLVLALLVFGGFIMHVHYISSRPLIGTFGFVAVSAMILAVSGMLIMFLLSVMD